MDAQDVVDRLVSDIMLGFGDETYRPAPRFCDVWRTRQAEKFEQMRRLAARAFDDIATDPSRRPTRASPAH